MKMEILDSDEPLIEKNIPMPASRNQAQDVLAKMTKGDSILIKDYGRYTFAAKKLGI